MTPLPRAKRAGHGRLHLHGGRAILAAIFRVLGRINGCGSAEAGEFTRRALLNGKLDLAAVEGPRRSRGGGSGSAQRRQALAQYRGALSAKVEAWHAKLIDALALVEAAIDFPTRTTCGRSSAIGSAGRRTHCRDQARARGCPAPESDCARISPWRSPARRMPANPTPSSMGLPNARLRSCRQFRHHPRRDRSRARSQGRAGGSRSTPRACARRAIPSRWKVCGVLGVRAQRPRSRSVACRQFPRRCASGECFRNAWPVSHESGLDRTRTQLSLARQGFIVVSAKTGLEIDELIAKLSSEAERFGGEPALVVRVRVNRTRRSREVSRGAIEPALPPERSYRKNATGRALARAHHRQGRYRGSARRDFELLHW